jgi:hypothetical protein
LAAAQASHAIFAAAQTLYDPSKEQPHFCICTVKNEEALYKVIEVLQKNGIRYTVWHEPDFPGVPLTAIATEPVAGEQRRLFKRCQLLKEKTPMELCAQE